MIEFYKIQEVLQKAKTVIANDNYLFFGKNCAITLKPAELIQSLKCTEQKKS